MRNLLALLTDKDRLNLPTNCVITKVYYDTQGTERVTYHPIKVRENHISVCMSNPLGTLWVDLLQLTRPLPLRENSKVDNGPIMLNFTKDEIIDFVNEVTDRNIIHREHPYVVPGLLILERLWKSIKLSTSTVGLSIRFLSPTLANDRICIDIMDNKDILVGKMDGVLLFKARLYHEHKFFNI